MKKKWKARKVSRIEKRKGRNFFGKGIGDSRSGKKEMKRKD